MKMNTTDKLDQENKMFGCSITDMDMDIAMSLDTTAMMSMSLISDAQEHMSRGYTEEARQTMNRAKYILSKIHTEQRLSA